MDPILSPQQRAQGDSTPDENFYDAPRFETHADDAFLDRLCMVYDMHIQDGDRIFDAMSSWVSHLPSNEYETVIGHGLNSTELAANPVLDDWFTQDLNKDQSLPLRDESFDAVLCALGVQYLQFPGKVFQEFNRILHPNGTLIVSFTNRMFPEKVIRAWMYASMDDRIQLVRQYASASSFAIDSIIREKPGNDPFVAMTLTPL